MRPIEQLQLFRIRVEELTHTGLIRNGFNPGITIKWDRMKGLRFGSREPNEEYLRSFLITFRQFISEKEPVFLNRIYNLCQQCLTSQELKGYLIKSRAVWKNSQKNSGMKLIFNRHELTPEYVTDLWINGYFFHNDYEKRSILIRLLPHESMLIRSHFLNFLVDATRQVLYVGNVVTVALREGLLNKRISGA